MPNPIIEDAANKASEKIDAILRMEGLTDDEKSERLRNVTCGFCAVAAIQPIPFADIFILTPIQGVAAAKLAHIRGVPVTKEDVSELVKQLVGLIGMGFAAQQIAIGIWKTVTWGLGGFLTIPMVYALSYAILKAADLYYQARAKGKTLSNDELREILKAARSEGKREAKNFNPGEEGQ